MTHKNFTETLRDITEAATFGKPTYKATDFTMNQKTVDMVIKELQRCAEHLDPGYDMANVVLQDINKLIKTLSDGRGSSTILVKELRRITKYLDPGYNMADAALQDINKLIKTLKGKATITEASKSQIEALEKAVEQATKNKDKTYEAHSEALEALGEAEAADDEAGKVKQDAIKALAAAKAENGRVVYSGPSRRHYMLGSSRRG